MTWYKILGKAIKSTLSSENQATVSSSKNAKNQVFEKAEYLIKGLTEMK